MHIACCSKTSNAITTETEPAIDLSQINNHACHCTAIEYTTSKDYRSAVLFGHDHAGKGAGKASLSVTKRGRCAESKHEAESILQQLQAIRESVLDS